MSKYEYPANASPEQKAAIRRKARAEARQPGGPVNSPVQDRKPQERPQKVFNGRRVQAKVYQITFLGNDVRQITEYIPEQLAWFLYQNGHMVKNSVGEYLGEGYNGWSWNHPDYTNETYVSRPDHALVQIAQHILQEA